MKKYSKFYRLLFLIAAAFVLAYWLQYASLKAYEINAFEWIAGHSDLFFLSAGILFLLLLGLDALTNNIYFALITGTAVIGLLGGSHYQKLKLIGEPVYPWDFNQIKNLQEMLQIVRQIVSPAHLALGLLLVVLLLAVTFRIPRRTWPLPFRLVSITAAAFALFFSCHLDSPVFAKSLQKAGFTVIHWDQKNNYLTNGFMMAFLGNIGAKIQLEPRDYNEAAMKGILQKYGAGTALANKSLPQEPNIVFVMDESLFDPTRLPGLSFSEDPMPGFHLYQKSFPTGWTLSPTFGGGTANVEFEALTGLNMSFMNEGAVPYQQVLVKKNSFPSLVSLLNDRGYQTTAVHPFDKTFYSRNHVYSVLGFNEFISQDTMKYKETLSNYAFISDMSAAKEVVDVLKSGDKPHFVHLVTMQNHIPIQPGMNGASTVTIDGVQGDEKTEMESYAQSVKETDKAVGWLTETIQSIERPTLIVMWGDHLPTLHEQMFDRNLASLNPAQKAQFLHETPLLVAANFPLPKQDLGTLSPSYFGPLVFGLAGQPMPPFYQLLEKVKKELPGLSRNVYVDGKGTAVQSLSVSQKDLLHDYELVQYDLLYGKGYAASLLQ